MPTISSNDDSLRFSLSSGITCPLVRMDVTPEFISIGGNRNPAAADWDEHGSGLLAFGAGCGIALWEPQDEDCKGVIAVLNGHTRAVNTVAFLPTQSTETIVLLSGAADNDVRMWVGRRRNAPIFQLVKIIKGHTGPVTKIVALPGTNTFASGASDGTVKIWEFVHDEDFSVVDAKPCQTITLSPTFFPLNLAFAKLDESSKILAVAGTRSAIQIFTSEHDQWTCSATLTGHEGWIRALSFTRETTDAQSDLLLASASQDKYIRLWRVHRGEDLPAANTALSDPALGGLAKSLSNKAHWISTSRFKYSLTFEALLLGHEDWIYQAAWRHRGDMLQLLSVSEDNSLAIWESDAASGVWVCTARLGEMSGQKGSTSATGSAGGFWIGLWSPDGNSVVSLGRTGSWRRWTCSLTNDTWEQRIAITGHIRQVKGVSWSRDGSYLLTTSSDQTTRLFSQWKRVVPPPSWHEFSRPQIHGYDLNCIAATSNTQFVSGADEKLLRVFDEPKGVAQMLSRLCGIQTRPEPTLPDAANMPVLSLSNKAIRAMPTEPANPPNAHDAPVHTTHPPLEDSLARQTLFPESEKLYGHGYELACVAASHASHVIATACRASSLDHAVVRLYSTRTWLEKKPALKAHTLTVTALAFSRDDEHLLTVGRDRRWVVWTRQHGEEGDAEGDGQPGYRVLCEDAKGHARMILGAAWGPGGIERVLFFTAGRDKVVKMWQVCGEGVKLQATLSAGASVTAVACCDVLVGGEVLFAFGTEEGEITVGRFDAKGEEIGEIDVVKVRAWMAPNQAVNQIAWRPRGVETAEAKDNGVNDAQQGHQYLQLAVVSDDTSLRIYNVKMGLPKG